MADPRAPALAASRERHQQDARLFWWIREDGSRDEFHYCQCSQRWPCEVASIMAAYDAQAARLTAVEQALLDWQDHLARVHRIACDYPIRSVRGPQGEASDG